MSFENDPRMQSQRLSRGMGTNKMLKFFGFCVARDNRIAGFGTTHGVSPPVFSLSSLLGPVKLGSHLCYAVLRTTERCEHHGNRFGRDAMHPTQVNLIYAANLQL